MSIQRASAAFLVLIFLVCSRGILGFGFNHASRSPRSSRGSNHRRTPSTNKSKKTPKGGFPETEESRGKDDCDVYIEISCISHPGASNACNDISDQSRPSNIFDESTSASRSCKSDFVYTLRIENVGEVNVWIKNVTTWIEEESHYLFPQEGDDVKISRDDRIFVEGAAAVNTCDGQKAQYMRAMVTGETIHKIECDPDWHRVSLNFLNTNDLNEDDTNDCADLKDNIFLLRRTARGTRKKTCGWLAKRPQKQRRRICRRKARARKTCPGTCEGICSW